MLKSAGVEGLGGENGLDIGKELDKIQTAGIDRQKAMEDTEQIYLKLLETSSPQAARTVLPNSCKTELIVYCNLQEWKHIFKLRTTKAAEPSMREIMIPLYEELMARFPELRLD